MAQSNTLQVTVQLLAQFYGIAYYSGLIEEGCHRYGDRILVSAMNDGAKPLDETADRQL